MKLYQNALILLFFLCCSLSALAQEKSGFEIKLKDQHTANLSKVLLDPSGKYLITGDIAGKVLMVSTSDYGFHKRIAPATGIPVNQLLFTDDGKLLINKRQDYYSGGALADSLLKFDLQTLEKELIAAKTMKLLETPENEGTVLVEQDPEDQRSDLLYYIHPADGSKSFSLSPGKKIKDVAFSETNTFALVTNEYGTDFLEVFEQGGERIFLEEMPLNISLKQLHYSSEKKGFFILTFNKETNEIQLQFMDLTYKKEVLDTQTFPLVVDVVVTPSDMHYSAFVVTGSSPGNSAIVYKRENGNYKSTKLNLEEPSSLGIYLPKKKQYVFWQNFEGQYDNMVNFIVYSESPFKEVAKFPNPREGKYRGLFLPGDNWMAIGSDNDMNKEQGFSTSIKYFETGTFTNRFGKLDYDEYIKLTHGVEKSKALGFHLDELSGTIAFSAMQQRGYDFVDIYYTYDLLKDQIKEFRESIAGFYEVAGFNAAREILLVSTGPFFINGYEESRPLKLVSQKETIDLEGTYKQALFSNNGNYLLTVNSENRIGIFDISKRKGIFSQDLGSGSFHLFADGEDLFVLSWSSSQFGSDCGKKTLTIAPDETGAFTAVPQDCVFITDYDHKEEIMALLVENSLVVVNNQPIMIYGDQPVGLSLNSDGSRLMLSFISGKTEIYDTASVMRLGSMYHPDKNSHLFVNTENRYFSNFDPADYLYAERAGTPVSLEQAGNYYDPPALLELFGTPDPEYVAALQKAGSIREEAIKNENSKVQGPQILQVWLDGNSSLAVTEKPLVEVRVETQNEGPEIDKFKVKLNGVELQELKFKKEKKGILSFELPLVDKENNIEISAINSREVISLPVERNLLYTGTPLESNLYVLAIGVSDYQQSAWDLTFADKDAMDIARFYGGFNEEDQKLYEDKFLGQRFHLQNKGGIDHGKISRYSGSYAHLSFLKPLTPDGKRWLGEERELKYQLWDFEAGTITDMELPEDFNAGIMGHTEIFPKPEGDAFYFRTENRYFEYDFSSANYKEIPLPFEKSLEGSQEMIIRPLDKGKWMSFETENVRNSQEGDRIKIHIAEPKAGSWKTREVAFNLPGANLPAIKGVTQDGNGFLLELAGQDSLLLVSAEGDSLRKQKIPMNAEIASWYEFSPNGTSFSELRLEIMEDQSGRNTYLQYDLQGKLRDSIVLGEEKLRGISNYNGSLTWVGQEPPMVDDFEYIYGSEEKIMNASPVSFANTYVEFLVDRQATNSAIKERLGSFLAKARPQDQIMVFLAGHGVLDKDNNYYYAPHDMDFEQVEMKGVSFEGILEGMTASPALKKLLLMDTCHSGNTFDLAAGEEKVQGERLEGQRGSVATQTGTNNIKVSEIISTLFDNFRSDNGITILSASSGEDVAYETRELGNGAFTTALLNRLRNSLGGDLGLIDEARLAMPVPLTEELIDKIQTEVMSLTNQKQVPDIREINELAKIKIW